MGHRVKRHENGHECGCSHKTPDRMQFEEIVGSSRTLEASQREYQNVWELLPGPPPSTEMRTWERKGPRERSFLEKILSRRDSCFSSEYEMD